MRSQTRLISFIEDILKIFQFNFSRVRTAQSAAVRFTLCWFHSEALCVSAPPSPLQLSEGSASLPCLLSGDSPQGALVSWTVDGSEVKEGVLTSVEEEKNGCYSCSSTLTLSKALWEKGEEFGCTASHDDISQPITF
ncbi:hypothetical protein AOLI_G00187920 [Acnodon oligacanthus]